MPRHRYREQREPHACLVKGCGTIIEHWKTVCDDCFRALPWATRNEIREAREAKAVHIVARLMSEGAAALAAKRAAAAAAAFRRSAAITGERID